jgi:hypothetical protein
MKARGSLRPLTSVGRCGRYAGLGQVLRIALFMLRNLTTIYIDCGMKK